MPLSSLVHRRIIRDLSLHFSLTLLFSLLIYFSSKTFLYVLLFSLGSILIDLDHLFDHFLYFGNKFDPSAFLNCLSIKSGKLYLPLHSWEIDFLIILLGFLLKSLGLLYLGLGIAMHLAIDAAQRTNPFLYFLTYRIRKKFSVRSLLPEVNL